MLAIHFKCGRDDGVRLNNLAFDKITKRFRSGKWSIAEEEARSLVGGWMYLQASKADLSEFGGVIHGFQVLNDRKVVRSKHTAFIVEKRAEGEGQLWRGASYGNAYSGGVVAAELPHEL